MNETFASPLSEPELEMPPYQMATGPQPCKMMPLSPAQQQTRGTINRPVERYSFDAGYIKSLIAHEETIEQHFIGYFSSLLSAKLRSRLRSYQLIEEVKQETFLRVFRTIRQNNGLENPGALGSFVNSVCNNVLFEVYRTESKRTDSDVIEDCESGDETAEKSLIDEQQRARIREVMRGMPEKDRTILRLIFFDEQDKDEVCRQLAVNRDYLRVLVQRAKVRFRSIYLKGPVPLTFDEGRRSRASADKEGNYGS